MHQVTWLLPECPRDSLLALGLPGGWQAFSTVGLVPSCGQGQHCPVHLLLDGLACSQRLNPSPHLYPTPLSRPLSAIQHLPPAGGSAAVAQACLEQDRGGAHHPENPAEGTETTLDKWRPHAELHGGSAPAGPGVDRPRLSQRPVRGLAAPARGRELLRVLSYLLGTSGSLSLLLCEVGP